MATSRNAPHGASGIAKKIKKGELEMTEAELKQLLKLAYRDIDYLLQEGFDTNVQECEIIGVKDTIKEIEKELGKPAEKKPLTIDEFSSKVSELSAIARDFRSDEWDEAEKLSGETIDNADNLEWDAVTCYLDELEEHLGNMKKDKEN